MTSFPTRISRMTRMMIYSLMRIVRQDVFLECAVCTPDREHIPTPHCKCGVLAPTESVGMSRWDMFAATAYSEGLLSAVDGKRFSATLSKFTLARWLTLCPSVAVKCFCPYRALLVPHSYTQGVAVGLWAFAPSGRLLVAFCSLFPGGDRSALKGQPRSAQSPTASEATPWG